MFCTVFFSQSIFRLSFPSVFVVYQTIPFMVIAILVLVGYIDKAALFCREPERGLVANIYDPSPFCLISGVGRLKLCRIFTISAHPIIIRIIHNSQISTSLVTTPFRTRKIDIYMHI